VVANLTNAQLAVPFNFFSFYSAQLILSSLAKIFLRFFDINRIYVDQVCKAFH